MSIGKIDLPLVVLLSLSIALGGYILILDNHIYEYAPSHAYTLMAFVALDAAFLGLLRFRTYKARKSIMVLASIQFLVMNLDIFTTANIPIFQVEELDSEELFEHLYGSWYFDVLLAVQGGLIAVSLLSIRHQRKIAIDQ